MGWKATLIKPYAKYIAGSVKRCSENAIADQQTVLNALLNQAALTQFGRDHHFDSIRNYEDYKKQIPIRQYEDFQPYLDQIFKGESNVLWPGRPVYFAKSSGTTSGAKYIPISRDSIGHHFFTAQAASLLYLYHSGNYDLMDGRMLFLSGSPELEMHKGIPTGRLSGIVNHHIPAYLSRNRLPGEAVNQIEDWEAKLDAIIEEAKNLDLRLLGGIPPWMQMFFDRLKINCEKEVKAIFPNLQLLVHGGVNFEPYKIPLEKSIGKPVDMIETYPASEGFIAFQDDYRKNGLLLNTNAGMFYEFIPAEQVHDASADRMSLQEVELGQNYAIVVSSNAGLWAYLLGDTVRFISLKPFRIKVTGRIKHFISAFGEHVIAEEVENAMQKTAQHFNWAVEEFTVAPKVAEESKNSYHEWFVAVNKIPKNLKEIAAYLDQQMQKQNTYYSDLIEGNIIQPLKINCINISAFHEAMRKSGKLGGQNKIPRLKNDRSFVDLITD